MNLFFQNVNQPQTFLQECAYSFLIKASWLGIKCIQNGRITFLGEKLLGIFSGQYEFAWDGPQQFNDQSNVVYHHTHRVSSREGVVRWRGGPNIGQLDQTVLIQTFTHPERWEGKQGDAAMSWQHRRQSHSELFSHQRFRLKISRRIGLV